MDSGHVVTVVTVVIVSKTQRQTLQTVRNPPAEPVRGR